LVVGRRVRCDRRPGLCRPTHYRLQRPVDGDDERFFKSSGRLEILQARALTESTDELGIVRLANAINRQRWSLGLLNRKRPDLGPSDPIAYGKQFKAEAK
jgi:hypothetical protein